MATKRYKKEDMEYAVMQAKDDVLRAWQSINNYVYGMGGISLMSGKQSKRILEIAKNISLIIGDIEAFAEDEIYSKEAEEEKAYRQYLKDVEDEIEAMK